MATECHDSQCPHHACHTEADSGPFCYEPECKKVLIVSVPSGAIDTFKLMWENAQMQKDSETEQMIQEAGKTAPRITVEHIESLIDKVEYHELSPVLTVCVITLVNGFHVTGESACVSPENFDKDIGEYVALRNAKEKIWTLEGYVLRNAIFYTEHNSE